ncbi:cilia- and flagella-associated protein 70-like isoform X2 [Misgurnus anguillicaudatus]|uniref:cilia- and flagella-associated protein 70-like isoform X2 n=1 Tax=Misgurnus anguillicaudatus TaxID=75329 RepID=UPI003CCFCFE8
MESHREFGKAAVQITVLKGNHLRGSGAESCLSFVRVEFNGCALGDSQKLDVAVDKDAVYNFTCSFECSEGAHTLDDLAHKPVILTVIEILPKEKKQKEEKTAVLGQAVVDLLPLLKGQCSFLSCVQLHSASGSSVDDGVKPTLDVSVSVQEPLLSDVQISESNLLMVTVETAYSIPDIWNAASTPPSSYVAALQIPLSAGEAQALLFSNGTVKMGGERESVPRPKKWPVGPLLAPGAEIMEGQFIDTEPMDMGHGDLTDIEDTDFRADAECNRKRVSWDTMQRCFIDTGGVACLSRKIAECRLWPIEIMRCTQTAPTKSAKNSKEKQGEDEAQISFHGVVYMDLAPLLYPGVRRIHGAYRIYPFYESDLLAKAQRTHSVLKEQLRAPGNKDAFKKGKPAQTDSPPDMEVQVNMEGQMYAESRSYIVIEIALEKPLVPKRPPEVLAKRVMELIPPRPPLPRRPAGAERAVHEYQSQIASVAAQVLDQYQQLFGEAFVPGGIPVDPTLHEHRKAQLIGELNYSGKYFAFKEQMKTLSVDSQDTHHEPLLSCSQLKLFAKEAELNTDYQQAAQYYQECLVRDGSDPSHWFDYGAFHILTAEHIKAEECFQQALSIDQTHTSSLLMCGVLSEMNGRYEDAEIFFERATCVEPNSVVAWTVLGLFCQSQDKSIQAEMAFLEANKQLSSVLQNRPMCGTEITSHPHTESGVKTTIYMETVRFLLQNYALQMAQRALAQELLSPDRGLGSYHLALAQLQLLRGDHSSAEESLREALMDNYEDPDIWALWGHLHFMRRDFSQAQSCYERTLDSVLDASDKHSIYLRLGSIYLQDGEYKKAKSTFLQACRSSPSCLTWLGLGTACYRLDELTEAEDALTEANALNNRNAEVWGFLALVCLRAGKKLEAEQSYKYAIKMNLQKESLLQEIHDLQARVGFGNPSF